MAALDVYGMPCWMDVAYIEHLHRTIYDRDMAIAHLQQHINETPVISPHHMIELCEFKKQARGHREWAAVFRWELERQQHTLLEFQQHYRFQRARGDRYKAERDALKERVDQLEKIEANVRSLTHECNAHQQRARELGESLEAARRARKKEVGTVEKAFKTERAAHKETRAFLDVEREARAATTREYEKQTAQANAARSALTTASEYMVEAERKEAEARSQLEQSRKVNERLATKLEMTIAEYEKLKHQIVAANLTIHFHQTHVEKLLAERVNVQSLCITGTAACEYMLFLGRRFDDLLERHISLEADMIAHGIDFPLRPAYLSRGNFDKQLKKNLEAYVKRVQEDAGPRLQIKYDAVMDCVLSLGRSRPVADLKNVLGRDLMDHFPDVTSCAGLMKTGILDICAPC